MRVQRPPVNRTTSGRGAVPSLCQPAAQGVPSGAMSIATSDPNVPAGRSGSCRSQRPPRVRSAVGCGPRLVVRNPTVQAVDASAMATSTSASERARAGHPDRAPAAAVPALAHRPQEAARGVEADRPRHVGAQRVDGHQAAVGSRGCGLDLAPARRLTGAGSRRDAGCPGPRASRRSTPPGPPSVAIARRERRMVAGQVGALRAVGGASSGRQAAPSGEEAVAVPMPSRAGRGRGRAPGPAGSWWGGAWPRPRACRPGGRAWVDGRSRGAPRHREDSPFEGWTGSRTMGACQDHPAPGMGQRRGWARCSVATASTRSSGVAAWASWCGPRTWSSQRTVALKFVAPELGARSGGPRAIHPRGPTGRGHRASQHRAHPRGGRDSTARCSSRCARSRGRTWPRSSAARRRWTRRGRSAIVTPLGGCARRGPPAWPRPPRREAGQRAVGAGPMTAGPERPWLTDFGLTRRLSDARRPRRGWARWARSTTWRPSSSTVARWARGPTSTRWPASSSTA